MIKNLIYQLVVVVLVFNFVSYLRETALLETDIVAPEFHLTTLDGQVLSNSDLKGKPSLVYFWAPWCGVCKHSLPNLESFYQENKMDVNVISVVLSYESIDDVHMAMVKHKLSFPTLLGNPDVADKFKITGFPTYYVLDADGKVSGKSLGYSTEVGMNLRTFNL